MNLKKRLLYLSGQIGIMMLARYFFQWLMAFSNSQPPANSLISGTLFSAAAVGGVLLAFRVFDGVTDPVAGTISDLWVGSGHKRRTLILTSFLLPPLGLVLCFVPDFDMGTTLRWTILVIGMFVFFVGYTFYAIPYWSLIEEYSENDADERRRLSNLLGIGLITATGLAFIVSPIVVDRFGFFLGACAFAGIALVLMLLPYFAQPVGCSNPTPAEMKQNPELRIIFSDFFQTFKHIRFMALLFLFSGSQMSFTIMTAATPFIAVKLLGGSESDVAYLTGPLILLTIPGFILAPRFSRTIGWEKAMVGASLLLGGIYFLSAFIGSSLIPAHLVIAACIFACAGPMTAILLGLEGEAVTSCAKERGEETVGLYFGVLNLVVKSLNGVAILLAGVLVTLSNGSWGTTAVRAMMIVAGGCLFIGVSGYTILRCYLNNSQNSDTSA